MKKVVLAFTILAIANTSAPQASILVNTISFADSPGKLDNSAKKMKEARLNKIKSSVSASCKTYSPICSNQVKNSCTIPFTFWKPVNS